MFRLIRDNVVKLTADPDKRDRLIADGYRLEQHTAEKSSDKPASGKAADGNGKRTDKA
jgi:hypothetical protein